MHNTTDLPNEIHVAVGEDLTPHPLHLDREEIQRLLYDGGCSDALLQSIVDADLNKIMLHLQPHDPVSWHCTSKSAQQQWFLTVRPREAVYCVPCTASSRASHEESVATTGGRKGIHPLQRTAPLPHPVVIPYDVVSTTLNARPTWTNHPPPPPPPPHKPGSLTIVFDVLQWPLRQGRCPTARGVSVESGSGCPPDR